MMLVRKITSCLILIILMVFLPAYNVVGAKYLIKNYDFSDCQKISGSIWAMVQAPDGVIYFGGDNGVITYNGAKWDYIKNLDTQIRSLFIDSSGQIYYGGTEDFGLIKNDVYKGLYHVSLKNKVDSLLSFSDVWSIDQCNKTIYFQSKSYVFVFEKGQIKTTPVGNSYHRAKVIHDKFILNRQSIGLSYYEDNQFYLLKNGEFFKDFIIGGLIDLPSNEMLVFTRGNGIFKFNINSGKIEPAFSGNTKTDQFLKKHNIYHAITLPDNSIAIATLYDGLIIIDDEGNILKHLNRISGAIDNSHYFLGVSNKKNLWICTANGLSVFNFMSPFIYWDHSSGLDGIVLDIEKYENLLYVGTLNGLFVRTCNNEINPVLNEFNKIISSDIWNISRVEINGSVYLYIASGQGLYYIKDGLLFQESRGELVHKIIQSKINKEVLFVFYKDKIDVYRWNKKKFIYSCSLKHIYNSYRSAMEDINGNIWVGTRTNEIHKLSVAKIIEMTKPGSERLALEPEIIQQSFRFDYQIVDVFNYHGLPIVSANGLFEFSYADNAFIQSTSFIKNMLDTVGLSAFIEDSHENIWIGGNNILLHQPEGTFVLHKMPFSPLKDLFSSFVFEHDEDNKTWIGGNKGLYLFDNKYTKYNTSVLNVLINKIVINEDLEIYPGALQENTELGISVTDSVKKYMAKKNHNINFIYALPYFEDASSTMYSYLLEGYQNKWSEWSKETNVGFNNLQPGEYQFKVKAKNIFEEESNITSFVFYVPNPWYSSIAFLLFVFVLFIIGLYLFIHKFSEMKLKKQLSLEEIIQNRIKEDRTISVLETLMPDMNKKDENEPDIGFQSKNLIKRDVDFLNAALNVIDANIDNTEFDVNLFCEKMGMSQTKLYRKLNSLVGMSITKFIRNTRLKKAAQLLWESDLSISEIAYKTGFNTPSYFTKCFCQEFGITPSEFIASGKK